ncbi:uncharacterized protein N7483_002500 [Penicillium malachiteum]|uniref:uncharacterized protein n=1 Tax=Penicillium malachiteum TaxID=1324776 RepID=UPI0025496C2C|nr:uncharacterized protein N7483_002399 [Penicillium malachiteum]XP_056952086.1 uncharacterized protein N7483_002500 [Penicillium malachiteum]KAJ5737274.1 hypothetical protein N7483_002399 [Penicillium malachiteum]KAJ5737375.1 hypothetical protein N7483_002500 [Penicillium malachiteum]
MIIFVRGSRACCPRQAGEQSMTTSNPIPSIPSEFDDKVDNADADLPSGHVWAYPCKLPSCPDYGKSWVLRSNSICRSNMHTK